MTSQDVVQKAEAQRIGRRITWAREALGYNRSELSRELGIDPAFVGKIETGLRIPSVFLVMSLCHVLHISPQYLLWGSLQGVDGELAAKLGGAHPELLQPLARPYPGKTRTGRRTKVPVAAL